MTPDPETPALFYVRLPSNQVRVLVSSVVEYLQAGAVVPPGTSWQQSFPRLAAIAAERDLLTLDETGALLGLSIKSVRALLRRASLAAGRPLQAPPPCVLKRQAEKAKARGRLRLCNELERGAAE